MKKIILLIMVIASFSVMAEWSTTRTITDNSVELVITPESPFDTFTVVETFTDTVVEGSVAGCGKSNNVLTCDVDGLDPVTIMYSVSGVGSVTGTVNGVANDDFRLETKTILGDTIFGESCVPDWICDEWSECAQTQTRTCTDNKGCGTNEAKPEESQACFECEVDVDCDEGTCQDNICVVATCTDGIQNGNENGIDCDGDCDSCLEPSPCGNNIIDEGEACEGDGCHECRYVEIGFVIEEADCSLGSETCELTPITSKELFLGKLRALVAGECYPNENHPAALFCGENKVEVEDGRVAVNSKNKFISNLARELQELFR
jgi:hypothetical protein